MSRIEFQTFKNNFEVLEKLGQGNCADVFHVYENKTGKRYAIKANFFQNIDQMTQAFSEIQIIRQIDDPAVPKIYYYFARQCQKKIDNQHFSGFQLSIIMEKCDRSLEKYLYPKDGSYMVIQNQDIELFLQTMSPLFAKMQRLQILHRDIKPANFLVNLSPDKKIKQFKLADFGYSVIRSLYSGETISGTKEYVSPRIYPKFQNSNLTVDQINFKDDVFSLGKTIYEMIRRKNISNDMINQENIRAKLTKRYNQKLVEILLKMLKQKESQRIDFLELQKLVRKWLPKNKVQVIDVDIWDAEQSNPIIGGYPQNYSSQHQARGNSFKRQNQIGQCMSFTRRKDSKLNLRSDDDETKYFMNQKQQGQSHQPQKLYLRKREIDFCSNEIYCMKVIGDFALLGMNSRLAIISLKDINHKGNAYLMKFSPFDSLKSNFKIKKIQVFSEKTEMIVLKLEDNRLIYIDIQKLAEKMQTIFMNHTELERNQTLKQIFKHNHSSSLNFAKIYEFVFDQFNLLNFQEEVSCLQISAYKFNIQGATILGLANGQIKLFQSDTIYKGTERIEDIRIFDDNKLIFSTAKQISILKLVQTDSKTKEKIKAYHHTFESQIVYFKVIGQNNADNNQSDLTPFVEVITQDGKKFQLTQDLQVISFNRLQKKSTIRYVAETHFNWFIKKEKHENEQNFVVDIKKIANRHQNDTSVSYLSSSGLLKYVDSRQSLSQVQFHKVSCYHIDPEKIVICKLDGRVQVLYTSNEPPKRVPVSSLVSRKPKASVALKEPTIPQIPQMSQDKYIKSSQDTNYTSRTVQNGTQYNESQNIDESVGFQRTQSHYLNYLEERRYFKKKEILHSGN